MLDVLVYAFNAIVPILLLVLLGYALKRTGLFTKEWLRRTNTFNFHYCLMALMFCNVYALDDLGEIDWSLALFILLSLLVLTLAGLLLSRFAAQSRNQRGVLIQVAFRSNFAIIGIPLAEALAAPGGVALISAMQAPAVIYFNFTAVLALSHYAEGKTPTLRETLKSVAENPLIRGLVLGLLALAIRSVLPRDAAGEPVFTLSGSLPFLYSAISSLSKVASPLALIVLGGQFEFGEARQVGKPLALGVLTRLVFAPLVGFGLFFLAVRLGFFEATPTVISTLIPLYSTPVAAASAVMATEMGADDVLAGQLVVWTTALSLFTLFAQIALFRFAGLL